MLMIFEGRLCHDIPPKNWCASGPCKPASGRHPNHCWKRYPCCFLEGEFVSQMFHVWLNICRKYSIHWSGYESMYRGWEVGRLAPPWPKWTVKIKGYITGVSYFTPKISGVISSYQKNCLFWGSTFEVCGWNNLYYLEFKCTVWISFF